MNVALTERLRGTTRERHAALEATPFGVAMQLETLPLTRYVDQLRAYAIVYEALEQELTRCTDPTVTAVWNAELAKAQLIQQDLAHLAELAHPPSLITLAVARRIATEIHYAAEANPVALLGFLYVMEGSTLGAALLRGHLASAFTLSRDRGLAYYSCADGTRDRWLWFKERLDRAVSDPSQRESVVAASDTMYGYIADILFELSDGLEAVTATG